MSSKKTIRGIRDKIPVGYVLGRSGNGGDGAVGLVRMADLATKAYVAQTAGLQPVNDGYVVANTTGGSAVPTGVSLTSLIDYTLAGAAGAQGQLLYRGTAAWVTLAPATSGWFLKTQGAGANPAWAAVSELPTISNHTILSNISGSTALPVGNLLTAILDDTISSTQGAILYRGSSTWGALGPGTSGQVLETQGASANPTWASISALLDTAFGTTQGSVLYRGASLWAELGPGTSGFYLKTLGSSANPAWAAAPVLGSGSTGALVTWSNSTTLAAGDLTGDVTTSGGLATTIKSSVNLSGNPTTTTQASNDSSTKIATTAFVQSAAAAGFVPTGAAAHPGYISGKVYGPVGVTGASRTFVTGVLDCVLIYVPVTTTFTAISVNLASNSSVTSIDFGVYANTNGFPGALVQNIGTLVVSSTGVKTKTASITLAPGWYWLGAWMNGTAGVTALSALTSGLLGQTNAQTPLGNNMATQTIAYSAGNLPNPFAGALAGQNIANICLTAP